MKKTVLLFFAAFLFIATTAMADQLFNFTYSDASISGSGQLSAVDNGLGNGGFTALTGTSTGVLGPLSLVPDTNAPNNATSNSGLFAFNNQIYPQQPYLDDIGGLLFSNADGSLELNIWGSSGPNINYSIWTEQNGVYVLEDNGAATFTLTEVPEPSTMLLLSAGLLGLAAARKRAKK
jgi:PEP-CTERM motif